MDQTGLSLDGVGDESRVGATLAVAHLEIQHGLGCFVRECVSILDRARRARRDATRASPTSARTAPNGTSAVFPVRPRPGPGVAGVAGLEAVRGPAHRVRTRRVRCEGARLAKRPARLWCASTASFTLAPTVRTVIRSLAGSICIVFLACCATPVVESDAGPVVTEQATANAAPSDVAPPVVVAPSALQTDAAHSPTPEEPQQPPQTEHVPMGILARLEASFTLDHEIERRGVRKEIDALVRRPNRLTKRDRLLEYLPYLCERVWERNLPGEICLLPIVESKLDPFAFSPGGAVGLWQFIPATARRFGLKIDWWVDERRDVVLATDAALDYLEELHDRFGDWLLAFAAYNWGEGRVTRELRRVGPDATFYDLKVPGETSHYVDRLLAYAAVFADPDRFGVELPLSEQESTAVAFAVVDTGGQVDLARAAEVIGCELDEIYQRNPGLKRWATHPQGPHRLLVSAADETRAAEALAGIPDHQRLSWIRHRISSGETLGEIAMAYRTSVATLQEANRLGGTLIRAGDHLLVPTTHRPLDHYRPPSQGRRGQNGIYVVKAGDTIWHIARQLGVARRALLATNGMGPADILRIGQRLSIPR